MKFPFGKTQVQKLETTIASLAKRADALATKRAKAQEALEKATSARQQALLAGDLDDQRALDKLQTAVDAAGSALTGIDDALAILARQRAEAEAQLTAERERVARGEAADRFDKAISAIEAAAAPWLELSRIYADALSEIAHAHFGCDEMSKFLQSCMGQMETAANFHLGELKVMPEWIRDGRQDIPPKKPELAPVAVVEPPPPTRTVFCLRSIKWDNGQRTALQYEDVDLPVALADKAMRRGACVSVTDDRRKSLKGARGGHHVNVEALDIVDLDDLDDPKAPYIGPDPVLRQADFRTIDRSSEERVIQIPALRAG
jgi:hypothetical protein